MQHLTQGSNAHNASGHGKDMIAVTSVLCFTIGAAPAFEQWCAEAFLSE
jgi:hypothetical protein